MHMSAANAAYDFPATAGANRLGLPALPNSCTNRGFSAKLIHPERAGLATFVGPEPLDSSQFRQCDLPPRLDAVGNV